MDWKGSVLFVVGFALVTGCQISLFGHSGPREEYLNQLLHARENNPHGQFLQAKRYLDQGKGEQAEMRARRALKADGSRAEFYIALGVAHEEQNQWRAAKRAYMKALQLNPVSAQAHIKLGRLAWRRGDLEEAKQWPEKASRFDDSADLWRLRGEIAYISLRYQDAVVAWRESLKRAPDQPILQELVNDLAGYVKEETARRVTK